MELMWQINQRGPVQPEQASAVRADHRVSRRQHQRHLRPRRSMSSGEQNNLIDNSELTIQHSIRSHRSNIVSSDRLTLLTEPMAGGASLLGKQERDPPINTRVNIREPTSTSSSTTSYANNMTTSNIRGNPNSRDSNLPTTAADGQSSFSSTTALLIVLIIYIIWQCFRGQSSRQPKCLDDWPATLLSPSKKKKRRESCELEMQTIEGRAAGASRQQQQQQVGASLSRSAAAVLRLRGDTNQTEIEVIQSADGELEKVSPRLAASKVAALKRSIAKNSFVVAANRAAKPRVKLIGDTMRKFVDIEAQEARSGHEINKTMRGRLLRLLHTSVLAKAFVRKQQDTDGTAHGHDDQRPDVLPAPDASSGLTPMQVFRSPGDTTIEPTGETIEVLVHSNNQTQADSRSESLMGFAGSFLESTINPASSFGTLPSSLAHQNDTVASHLPSPLLATAFNPNQLNLSSPNQITSELSNSHIPCNHPHSPQLQHAACDCVLARSSSQSNHPSCAAHHQLLAASPTSVRPCCPVSPAAMSRHHQVTGSAHACNHQQHPPSVLFGPTQISQDSATYAAALYPGAHLAASRPRHPYENYYDDEQEDAYRRLTASIGMQFGLALDQHNEPALISGACSVACKCAPVEVPRNFICPPRDLQSSLPIKSSCLSSGGESDSGNFSLINRKRVDSDNICNDSTCSLCQSSLLTTTAASQESGANLSLRRPSLDPASVLASGAPVPRWHQQRRSTLYARQPRRMSIAGFAGHSNQHASGDSQQQHLLHRASIGSDGTSSFFNHHQQHHLDHLSQHQNPQQNQAAAKQSTQPACQFFSHKANGYSSSVGGSSGIGFSGSRCLNTPTTSVYAHGSFITNKPYCDLLPGSGLARHEPQPIVCQFALTDDMQSAACRTQQDATLNSPTSRKYSLPVQLESHAAEHSMSDKHNLLFDSQCDQMEAKVASVQFRPTGRALNHPARSFSQMNECSSESRRAIGSPLDQKSDGLNRRLSQIITRQSSFWLEDENDSPGSSNVSSTTDEAANAILASELGDKRDDPNDSEVAAEVAHSMRQASSSPNPTSSNENQSPGVTGGLILPTVNSKQPRLSSSSTTSSPSPDFAARHKQRSLGRAPISTAIKKKRLLGSLKQRRSQRANSQSLKRRHGSQSSSIITEASLALKRQDTNSTDDEREKSKQEDGLSSFDREAASAKIVRDTTKDANSSSLERQCRDLWKLRATLHDDGSVCDSWSNYHQRLNRRYDSGYKSIENQFSSSIEGNVPNMMDWGLRQASPLSDNGNATRELDRPQSGCSGLIPEQNEETTQINLGPTLCEEETQSLLENCDDQQDEQ